MFILSFWNFVCKKNFENEFADFCAFVFDIKKASHNKKLIDLNKN